MTLYVNFRVMFLQLLLQLLLNLLQLPPMSTYSPVVYGYIVQALANIAPFAHKEPGQFSLYVVGYVFS